jgi:cold shock protein
MEERTKMEGTVKWFNTRKGYGFIKGEDDNEYFVHHSALGQGVFLRDNDKVSFDPADGEKGKQAQNVKLLQKASEMGKQETSAQEGTQDF